MSPMRDGRTTSEDSATQLLICEPLSFATWIGWPKLAIVTDESFLKNLPNFSGLDIRRGQLKWGQEGLGDHRFFIGQVVLGYHWPLSDQFSWHLQPFAVCHICHTICHTYHMSYYMSYVRKGWVTEGGQFSLHLQPSAKCHFFVTRHINSSIHGIERALGWSILIFSVCLNCTCNRHWWKLSNSGSLATKYKNIFSFQFPKFFFPKQIPDWNTCNQMLVPTLKPRERGYSVWDKARVEKK